MKRLSLFFAALFVIMGAVSTAQAQAPYKHSIGVTVGNMEAFSYKTFVTNHFAIQLDLGAKVTHTDGENVSGVNVWTFEFNPNFMYEGHFVKGLHGFIGGGLSMGYNWNSFQTNFWFVHLSGRDDNGKFGVNAITGLEYKFNAPVTLQLDFRPGYGLLFDDNWDWSYFDWSLNLGVRYAF